MLNINYGHNQELLQMCQPLNEYAHFIKLVREYSKSMNAKEAIDLAIEDAKEWECIGSFLYRCKSEVNVMLLTEFDEKKHEDSIRADERMKTSMKTIYNMFKLNLSPEIIAESCEVPIDYVLNLKKKLENKITN